MAIKKTEGSQVLMDSVVMNLRSRLGLEGDSGVGDGGQSLQQLSGTHMWKMEFFIRSQKMVVITLNRKCPEVMDQSQLKTQRHRPGNLVKNTCFWGSE